MFVSQFTVRLNNMEFPGSAHTTLGGNKLVPHTSDICPRSTASWLAKFILEIWTLVGGTFKLAASRSLPPGNSRSGQKTQLVSSGLYTNSSFSPDFPARKIPGLSHLI